jgi:hypothetical protein
VALALTGVLILREKQLPIARLVFWSRVVLLASSGACCSVKRKGLGRFGDSE